ncbi:hypothetical protein CVU82_01375 [Candidatus Falkowbacteria bacterium HGW-Falkowbacteria-1]|jgi:O-antigen ligase|uniref:O-antigen ligase-related domain-containing protein n=1 Tax=Candidatus Falkowbacteria bacterium HGW-Falkowbacteria-1 TaxID=2013768 RepID=A0A2N2EAU9_9BACT|nr:MAG: hypothetical protein CVU82_01375 [Candidatus Falkowbacteria bacterium HGW-Falkowbacteria-1]
MSEKNYLWILKIGVFASLLTLFFVFSDLLFPFVTSKQLSFNILIEILLVFYFVFIIKYPKYRPTKSLVTFGLLAYFVAIILSLFVSVDFNLSFWGDLERMLGLFHLLHFLALYFIVVSVFRTKKDYFWLFNVMILVCFVVALMMIGSHSEKYSQSILGNRAYLAAFMIFGIFLSFLMTVKNKEWWAKAIYLFSLPFFVYSLIKANVSGSHAGLMVGLFFSLLIFSIFSKSRKIKIGGISILLFFVISLTSLFLFRSNTVFDGTYLGQALRDFSSENITLRTRLISWNAAGHYLLDHPVNLIFGVGHGNYALVFDSYFDASFYDYDRHATYFDRAHNNLIDILATTGLIGLLTYLSLIFFLFYFLNKTYQQNKGNYDINNIKGLNIWEYSILSGLLVAYFVQNLAVFDSFSTYMYLMFFMAFVNFLEISNKKIDNNIVETKGRKEGVREEILFLFFGAASLMLIFNVNILAIKTSRKTIEAYTSLGRGDVLGFYQKSGEAFTLNSVMARDSKESYINLVTSNFDSMLEKSSLDDLEKIVLLAIQATDSNLNYNVNDSLMLFRSAKVYEMAGRLYSKKGDNNQAVKYNDIALKLIDMAIISSPQRVPLYSFKSSILLNVGREDEALESLNYAKNINKKMPDAFCQLANLNFVFENIEEFHKDFPICIEDGGLELMSFDSFISGFEEYFFAKEDFESLRKIYGVILEKYPEDIDWLSRSALVYYQIGDFDQAERNAFKILELDSSYKEDIDLFLEQLKSARAEANVD